MDYSPPGSSVHGMFQARIPAAAAKSRQSCPTLCDPIDGSPLDSSVPGILQARKLEWVSISSSRGSSRRRDRTRVCSPALQVDSFPLSHWGSLAMKRYTTGKRSKRTSAGLDPVCVCSGAVTTYCRLGSLKTKTRLLLALEAEGPRSRHPGVSRVFLISDLSPGPADGHPLAVSTWSLYTHPWGLCVCPNFLLF